MFENQLFKEIAYLLNSLQSSGKTPDQIADFIVINLPMHWVCVLGQGVYQHNKSAMLGDSVLVSLDIVQKSLNIKGDPTVDLVLNAL